MPPFLGSTGVRVAEVLWCLSRVVEFNLFRF